MANFEKVVVIPAELEREFLEFMSKKQKGNGIKVDGKQADNSTKKVVKKVTKSKAGKSSSEKQVNSDKSRNQGWMRY